MEDTRHSERQPILFKGGRTKYKRSKELGMETHHGEGVMKEEKFPNTRKPSHRQVCGEFWNPKGQHNWEEKKYKNKNSTDYTPNHNPQWRVAQTLMPTSNRG